MSLTRVMPRTAGFQGQLVGEDGAGVGECEQM